MAQVRRTSSRNSLMSEKEGNRSNSNKAGITRSTPSEKENLKLKKQSSSSSLKIFGGDDEVTEDVLWNGSYSDRSLPNSSRSSLGSARGRTPTPSKQISLQAVKRKEEKIEPLEKIDWNEIDKPVVTNERLPSLPLSDVDDDSPRDTILSPEEQQALVEQRAREMTSALSSCRIDEQEANLSKQLEQIETEREEKERKLNLELERHSDKTDHNLTVRDGQFTYRNDHFRDLSNRDKRDKIDSDFILDGMGNSRNNVVPKRRGENVIGRHAMDKKQETAISAEKDSQEVKQREEESEKKDEASAETSSDEESEDEDSDDLIGEKGKAPNNLLMEFLSCMMEEDYENAEKLCKMILIYEPDNQEALNFFPLIQEKRRLEEEEENDSSNDSDEDSDEDDDEDDEDDEDDDEDDDEEDDDDEDDESYEEDDSSDDADNEPVNHADPDKAFANTY